MVLRHYAYPYPYPIGCYLDLFVLHHQEFSLAGGGIDSLSLGGGD